MQSNQEAVIMNTQIKKKNPVVLRFFVITLFVGSIVLSNNALASHVYYWLFAKSSIESIGLSVILPPNPPGIPGFNPVTFAAFHLGTNNDFNEQPDMTDYNGVDIGTDDYRLFARMRISVKCVNGLPRKPTLGYKLTDGGEETINFPLPGHGTYQSTINVLDTDVQAVGTNLWIVNYVLSGKPHQTVEDNPFSLVKARTNKHIYQSGEIWSYCDNGIPQVSVIIRGDQSSKFPTHNASLWLGGKTPGTHTTQAASHQIVQQEFYELWRMDNYPAADSF